MPSSTRPRSRSSSIGNHSNSHQAGEAAASTTSWFAYRPSTLPRSASSRSTASSTIEMLRSLSASTSHGSDTSSRPTVTGMSPPRAHSSSQASTPREEPRRTTSLGAGGDPRSFGDLQSATPVSRPSSSANASHEMDLNEALDISDVGLLAGAPAPHGVVPLSGPFGDIGSRHASDASAVQDWEMQSSQASPMGRSSTKKEDIVPWAYMPDAAGSGSAVSSSAGRAPSGDRVSVSRAL